MYSFYGLMQPFADALKLFLKEVVIPTSAYRNIFLGAPMLTLALAFIGWAVIPLGKGNVISDLNLGILFLLAVSSFGVYGIVFSGWAANSKFALMGSLRSTAQMISYEVALSLLILPVVMCSSSYNLTLIAESQKATWFIVPLLPIALMFYISMLAETNRAPFDLPEAESELVAGYMTEHSAFPFAYFFLGEYGNMILISTLGSFLFLGGYLPLYTLVTTNATGGALMGSSLSLGIKVAILLFGMVWVRATLPRLTYKDLMRLMWKLFLPLSLAFVPAVLALLLITI
jgi:NADH-quinone oxidoreductase subunit H